MTETPAMPLTRRRFFFLLSMWALGIGVALVVLGWWVWRPVLYIGCLMLLLGVAWLACVPWMSDEPMSRAGRRYMRTALPAMGGYVLAVFVLGSLKHLPLPTWVMGLIALLPVLPIAWVVVAMWRLTRDSDELEQRVQLEAVFITCGVVGLLAFAFGMLQAVGVVHFDGGLILVMPAMFAVYGITGWWCRRKYGLGGMC